jgi:hypothetical protein
MHNRPSSTASRLLSIEDADILLSSFPTTRLSYEVTIHKNDTLYDATSTNDYKCFVLPKGRRCIAWATEWKQHLIFALIEIDGANHSHCRGNQERPSIRKFHQDCGWFPGKVYIYDTCFDRTLAYGTVFGGVMFRSSATPAQLFSIHTIYWYKGNQVPPLTALEHIRLSEELFYEDNIRQVAYTKDKSIIFGLPVLCNNEYDARRVACDLPYEIFSIQYRYLKNTRVCQQFIQDTQGAASTQLKLCSNTVSRPALALALAPAPAPVQRHIFISPPDEMLTNIQSIFIVRPNIQNDIYELFVISNNSRSSLIFHNFAHIPSFKTSVMMNKLFRNITENVRLDTLEESEDEIDFENTEPDKYVTLTKEYRMVCRFNKRFCKWVPIDISQRGDIATIQQVTQHESRYLNYRRNK